MKKRSPYCVSGTNRKAREDMPYSDEYVQYLEARLADWQNQRKTGHRDVQRLTNTTGNAPIPHASRQQTRSARQKY